MFDNDIYKMEVAIGISIQAKIIRKRIYHTKTLMETESRLCCKCSQLKELEI